MIPRIIQGSVAVFVAAFIASFGSSFVIAGEPNGPAIAKDPCALTLLPHEGTDKEDLEIIRLQTRVRDASDSTAVVQLGWYLEWPKRESVLTPDSISWRNSARCVWTERSLTALKLCCCELAF